MYTVEKTYKCVMPDPREDCWWIMGAYPTEEQAIRACIYYRNTLYGRVKNPTGEVVYVDNPNRGV